MTNGELMLKIQKAVITLDDSEVMALEAIIMDADEKTALSFLRKSVYDKVAYAQRPGSGCGHAEIISPPQE